MPAKTPKPRSTLGKRSGKGSVAHLTTAGSIQRYLAAERSSPGTRSGQARASRPSIFPSSHAAFVRESPSASSYCLGLMDDLGSPAGSEMTTLVSGLKKELAGMFHSLEKSIKKEITAVRADMSHILVRVEETEQRQDSHATAIKELQETVTQLALAHRASLYKLEELENRNRRNNLRVRGLPEATRDNDLEPSICGIFNTILGNPVPDPLRFDCVHHALRPCNVMSDKPRDVICVCTILKIKMLS